MQPLILNTDFLKRESRIGCPLVSNQGPSDHKPTVITITPCSTYNSKQRVLNFHIYPSIRSWNNPGNISFALNCVSALKSHTQRPEQHQTLTKTNHQWFTPIIYRHSMYTKLCHPACCVVLQVFRRRTSRNKKQNLSNWQVGLTRVINSRAVAHKSWIE